MGWLSDILSGDETGDGRNGRADPVERARQLGRGVDRAAAALADEHPALASSATGAAERLLGRLPTNDPELARDAAERLDRLHFDLLQVDVAGLSPEEAGVEEDVEAVRELAERVPGGGPASGSRSPSEA